VESFSRESRLSLLESVERSSSRMTLTSCFPSRSCGRELRLPVGIYNPHKQFSVELNRVATFRKLIRTGLLKAAQFPDTLKDEHGTITKPAAW
jgi:hypothetical protein